MVDNHHLELASLRAASCRRVTSMSSTGSCTYLTTEPRTKQFFTLNMYGNFWTERREKEEKLTNGQTCDDRKTDLCFQYCDVCQLEIEVLINTMQRSCDFEIILQFENHIFTHKTLEERVEEHN